MKQRNEGEGSKTAAKQYDKAATDFAKSGKVDKAAQDAASAVDSTEAQSMNKAVEEGKRRAKEEDPQLYKKGTKTPVP